MLSIFILFSIIFIYELVKSLDTSVCDPSVVNGLSVNSLLYADDITLLSDFEEGLQKSLDGLNIFLHQLTMKNQK